jgi:chromosome segregation ATPase
MTNNDLEGITFDPNSGISEDEQKEILAKINDIAESRRRSLSASADAGTEGEKRSFKAKKSGNIFPVLVNAAAIIALAGGLFVLSSFQGKADVQVRTGTKIYNSAERALIEEIRRETSSRLEAKEGEITTITSQLEEIDSELRGLHSSNEDLTGEQRATESRLKSLHEQYFTSLARLQDERSVILEEARAREAVLQNQLENRTRELALTEEQNTAAMEDVRAELERMSREQTQAATVEAQMGALFSNLYAQLRENRLDDASGTILSMRNFLGTPAFQSLRSIQARKELYTQSVNAFEEMINEARRNRAAMAGDIRPPDESVERTLAELQARNTELERTVEAFTSQGSSASRRLAELDRTITTLQNTNRTLETSSREKDSRINTLQSDLATQNRNTQTAQQETAAARQETATARQETTAARAEVATLTQTVATRDSTIAARESTIQELRGQISTRTNTLNVIRNIVANGETEDMTVGQLTNSLQSIRRTLNEN